MQRVYRPEVLVPRYTQRANLGRVFSHIEKRPDTCTFSALSESLQIAPSSIQNALHKLLDARQIERVAPASLGRRNHIY